MTNRGFVELHNPTGFFLVGLGFLLVTLIIAAGGILTMTIERQNVERRRQMREQVESDHAAEIEAEAGPNSGESVDAKDGD